MAGVDAHRVDGPDDVDAVWFSGHDVVGVTAGASAPDQRVRAVIEAVAPGGTVEIVLLDADGVPQNTPLIAGPVDAGGQWTALDVLIDPFPAGEPHSIQVTPINGGTATGIATLALQCLPIITAWK